MQQNIANQDEPAKTYKSIGSIFCIVSTYTISSIYLGYILVHFDSISIDVYFDVFNIDQSFNKDVVGGVLVGILPVGGLVGAMMSSYLITKTTRRNAIFIINCAAFVLGGLIYTPTFPTLIIFRFLEGCCAGIYSSIIPLILTEIIPLQLLSFFGAFVHINIILGAFIASFLPLVIKLLTDDFDGRAGWPIIFAFPFVLILIQTLLLIFCYPFETVKFLLIEKRNQEALEVIKIFYKEQCVEQVYKQLLNDVGSRQHFHKSINNQVTKESQGKNDHKEPQERSEVLIAVVPQDQRPPQQGTNNIKIQKEQQRLQQQQKKQKEHHQHQRHRRQAQKISTPLSIHIAVLSIFAGNIAIGVYGGIIGGESIPSLKQYMSTIVNGTQVISVTFSTCAMNYFGRKFLLSYGSLTHGIFCIMIGIGFLMGNDKGLVLIFVGMFLTILIFNLSIGPLAWVYIQQIVEPEVVPYPTAFFWISQSTLLILFPILTNLALDQNPGVLFFFFAVWGVASFFVNMKWMVQTKGKHEKQIRVDFMKMIKE